MIANIDGSNVREGDSNFGKMIATVDGGWMSAAAAAVHLLYICCTSTGKVMANNTLEGIMANKIGSKHGVDDKYPTTEDVTRALVETQDHLREIENRIYTPQARSANFVQLLDDLERHSNENKPFKFEEIMMRLMADEETARPGGGKDGNQRMLHFLNKHAASSGLDDRSVTLIKEAAKRDRRLAGDGLCFTKLPQELRIQLRIMVAAGLRVCGVWR